MVICRLEGIAYNLDEVHFVPSLIDLKYAQMEKKRDLKLFFPLSNRLYKVRGGKEVIDILKHQVRIAGQGGVL